jgi:hypothetical protein
VRLYLRWDLSNFVYLLFFPEFVCGLSHVGLYLEWDLSDFFFPEFVCRLSFVCRLLLSQFFFSCSCLIKLGPYEIEAFLIIYFMVRCLKIG